MSVHDFAGSDNSKPCSKCGHSRYALCHWLISMPPTTTDLEDKLRRIANIADQERQRAGASPWWQNVWEIANGAENS